MDKNKIRFTVAGTELCIVTNDNEEYIRSLAANVNDRIEKYTKNGGVSVTQAAALTAMEFADENTRKENILAGIKDQLKVYLDDAAKIKAERDQYKAEYEKLLAKKSDKKSQ